MTMKKRITSFALVLLMVLSSLAVLLPVTGVKAAAAGETKTYTKVTTAPTDWSGTYIIVYENGAEGYASNGTKSGYTAVSITDGKATAKNTTETLVDFEISKMANEGEYSIQVNGGDNNGKYIGRTSGNKGGEIFFLDSETANKLSMDGSNVKIECSSPDRTYVLRFNSGSSCFRYYLSGQQAIQLYKLDTSSTPTEPDVPVHEGKHTYGEWTSDNDTTHSHQCTFVGCKATEIANHEITSWTSLDANKHTGKCKDCGYTAEGAHNWETDTEATSVPDGKLAQKCSACGEKRIIATPKEVTIDFTAQGYKDKQAIEKYESDKFLLTFDKGSNSNAPKYYTTGNAIRMYGSNKLTIKGVNGEKIAKIEFTFASGEDKNAITATDGTFDTKTKTWTGSANEVTFTIDGSSGHRRIKSLKITYEAPATEPDTSKIIDSATLNIGTNIDVNYYVVLPEGISYEKYVMRFTFNGKTIDVESTTGDKFTFKNVGPHQMGLNISAVLYGVNGETETKLSEKATYSVKENLESLLTNENETVKTLAKNMLIYGAAAQKYTGAADADLVTSETHTATPNLTTSGLKVKNDATESAVIKFVGMKLIFDNEPILAIRYVIVWDDPDLTITANDITFKDGNDNVLAHDGEYVYLNSVTANKFGTNVTVKNDLDTSEVLLNVNTYIYYILNSTTASDNMKALATALYYYGVAAEAYVNAQTTQQ